MAVILSDRRDEKADALTSHWPLAALAEEAPAMESQLVKRLGAVLLIDSGVVEIVEWLRAKHQVPISFIESDRDAAGPVRLKLTLPDATVGQLLDEIVAQNPDYRYSELNGHLVIYPRAPKYDSVVSDVNIRDTPRVDAARLYRDLLVDRHIQGFGDLVEPPIKGNPNAPLYRELVSLQRASPIVEHLVQLLGGTRTAVFTLRSVRSSVRLLYFDEVAPAVGR